MIKKLLLASGISMVVLASNSFAADSAAPAAAPADKMPPKEGHKNPMDTNNDGVTSKAEFMAFQEKRFAEEDKNGDGNITKEEHMAARQEHKEHWKDHHAKKDGKSDIAPAAAGGEGAPAEQTAPQE